MERLKTILRELVATFKSDPTAAGIVISWLEDRQLWYMSFVRYTEPMGEGKQVICKGTGIDLSVCLEETYKRFVKMKEDVARAKSAG